MKTLELNSLFECSRELMEVTGLEDMMSPCTRETGNGCPASCLWRGLSGMGASQTVDWAMTVCFSTRVLVTRELMPPVRTIITLFVKLKIKSMYS